MQPDNPSRVTTNSSPLLRLPVLLAGALFAIGMLVLLSPVWTEIPRDGQFGNNDGEFLRICGPTIAQAFSVPDPLAQGGDRDSVLDCAAAARGRVGYGLLLLLLAVPPTAAALLTQRREGFS